MSQALEKAAKDKGMPRAMYTPENTAPVRLGGGGGCLSTGGLMPAWRRGSAGG